MVEETEPVPADINICDMRMEGRPDSDYINKYVLPQPSAHDLAHCARYEQRSNTEGVVEESREVEDEEEEEYDDDKASVMSVGTVANKYGFESDEIVSEWNPAREDMTIPGGGYWWCFMDQLLDTREELGIDVTRAFLTTKEDACLLELVALPVNIEERLLHMMGLQKAMEGEGEEEGGGQKCGELEYENYGRLIRFRDIFAI